MIPIEQVVQVRELMSKHESIRLWLGNAEENKPVGFNPKAKSYDPFEVSVRSAYSEGWKDCLTFLHESVKDGQVLPDSGFTDMGDPSDRNKQ